MRSQFQLNSSKLFLTYPQCPLKKEFAFELLTLILTGNKILNYVIAEEKHANGDDHIHCFLHLEKALRTTDPRCLDIGGYHGNYQGCRSDKNVLKYCTKKENYISNFDVNVRLQSTSKRKQIFTDIISGKTTLLEAIEAEPSLISGYRRLKQDIEAYHLDKNGGYDHPTTRGIWIWGEPGTGKSTMARTKFAGGRVYIKAQNKWWDGYNGEEAAVLEDLDTDCLNHYLKIWADKWSCTGETKGGTIQLRHKSFIVTSNYPIDHFCKDDTALCTAISRRFKVVKLVGFNGRRRNIEED